MLKKIMLLISLSLFLHGTNCISSCEYIFSKSDSTLDYSWTVVGAGPAGIITVALLLDLGISPAEILWIDPEFAVGRLNIYQNVPANTKTKLFISLMQSCKTFQECKAESIEKLFTYDAETEYPLAIIVKPLQDITNHIRTKVDSVQGSIDSLQFENDAWFIGINKKIISSTNVVLATGSHPRELGYECCQNTIPLDIALNKDALASCVKPEDCIAVVGSSHSAILILKYLTELPVQRIINFYKNPIQYAIDMGTWVLHNANGLKGITAHWAKEVLEKNPPAHLLRMYNNEQARQAWLPICTKIIYAVGYERNELPAIDGQKNDLSYDDRTGIIAPRLFGIGIAFPEKYTDPLGNQEHRVGINSFMDYAQRIIPQWISKEVRSRFANFEQLFTIELL